MELITYEINGLVSFQPPVFEDDRGNFFESYNKDKLAAFLGNTVFVQDNQSLSKRHVLRGLHFQNPPYAQGKLVRVIKGVALDIAVDIRQDSPTYGQYQSILLSEKNNIVFWIPEGFAHGFLSLEDDTIFSYKCTNFYNPESEGSLMWNDPQINIDWGIEDPIVSEKDTDAGLLKEFNSPFTL